MRDIAFKYKLKSKVDGDIIFVFAPLYDNKNGTMQFPIELDKWEVLNFYQCIGRMDVNGDKICENDKVKFKSFLFNKKEFEGIVLWNSFTCGFYIDRGDEISFEFNSDIFDIGIVK